MQHIDQTQPIAPWLGGKRNLAKRICKIIDTTPCRTYAEPFVGMGGIFLRRQTRPRAEVINDKARDIANLFRILQRHYPTTCSPRQADPHSRALDAAKSASTSR